MIRAEHSPTEPVSHAPLTRREVLRTGMFATMGAFLSTATAGAGAFLWPVKLTGFGGTVVVPTPVSQIHVGDVIKVREGKFYLTRTDDGLMALYWRCVHLGCTVPWVEADHLFECPCHTSVYQITGQNISGPAPRPLDYMELRVADDQVYVDTGKIHTRTVYHPDQAVKVESGP